MRLLLALLLFSCQKPCPVEPGPTLICGEITCWVRSYSGASYVCLGEERIAVWVYPELMDSLLYTDYHCGYPGHYPPGVQQP